MKSKRKLYLSTFIILVLLLSVYSAVFAYNESPMLKERVDNGELPPVEERLPEDPFVVGPGTLIVEEDLDWEVGEYGGTMTFAHESPGWSGDMFTMAFQSFLRAPGTGTDGMQGNLVDDYSTNDDNTVFTFHLREGLKWSDGEPVTTEDIRFTYEDVLLNEKITPTFPVKFKAGGAAEGERMELEIIDDHTFEITFAEPYGAFLADLTIRGWAGYSDLLKPKHHLTQYHIKYTDLEDMQEDLEEEDLDDEWWELFNTRDVPHWSLTQRQAIGFPVLYPWVRVEGSSGMMVFERNPYYHMVDTEGNQLPYIDKVVSHEVSELDMAKMKAVTGELDMFSFVGLDELALFKENAEKNGYKLHFFNTHTDRSLFMNFTYPDEAWREMINNVKFRRAISLGIDREEIIETVFLGFADQPEIVPAEYNPEKANQLLDELGLDERNNEGYRLGPDGEPFDILFEYSELRAEFTPMAELVTQYLDELGFKTSMKMISNELRAQRSDANQIQMTLGWTHSPLWDNEVQNDFMPGSFGWGVEWQLWYNNDGDAGEEPPVWVKEIYNIFEKRQRYIATSEEYAQATEELLAIYQEQIPMIGIVSTFRDAIIANENLGNIPSGGTEMSQKHSGVQYFFKQ